MNRITSTILGLIVGVVLTVGVMVGVSAVSADDSAPAPVGVLKADDVTWDDVLMRLHTGQWFGWSDPHNKTYEGLLILDNQYTKPTKAELQSAMIALQTKLDNRINNAANLEAIRAGIESRILAGTQTQQDLLNYLRILGGF